MHIAAMSTALLSLASCALTWVHISASVNSSTFSSLLWSVLDGSFCLFFSLVSTQSPSSFHALLSVEAVISQSQGCISF